MKIVQENLNTMYTDLWKIHYLLKKLLNYNEWQVGLDGTGKTTTVQLAAYVAGCNLFRVTLTRSYGLIDFREDLKKVCMIAGVKGHNTVFLLTDGDIVKVSRFFIY